MAEEEHVEERQAIHDAVQRNRPANQREAIGTAVLTNWTLVAEWMDDSGERWLSELRALGSTEWQAAGMHHMLLHGGWEDD